MCHDIIGAVWSLDHDPARRPCDHLETVGQALAGHFSCIHCDGTHSFAESMAGSDFELGPGGLLSAAVGHPQGITPG